MNETNSSAASATTPCSRNSDTPEVNADLARQTWTYSPSVSTELARKLERQRNTARVVAADAIRELERILDTGDTYASREIVENLKAFLRGASPENDKTVPTEGGDK